MRLLSLSLNLCYLCVLNLVDSFWQKYRFLIWLKSTWVRWLVSFLLFLFRLSLVWWLVPLLFFSSRSYTSEMLLSLFDWRGVWGLYLLSSVVSDSIVRVSYLILFSHFGYSLTKLQRFPVALRINVFNLYISVLYRELFQWSLLRIRSNFIFLMRLNFDSLMLKINFFNLRSKICKLYWLLLL